MGDEDLTRDERGCPDDDSLAAYLDHTATPELRTHIEAHVDRCATCREAIGVVTAATAPDGPRTIDRYRLDEKLGAGGMGVVWKAWDPSLERPLAIKLLHPDLDDHEGRERAMREARALARLHHPNVLAIYDVGEHDGDVFIATELIDGESMDRWQRGKSPAQILAAYTEAARGLAAAHALGLVHRDIKPSNILVAKSGRVSVCDFGLATTAAQSSVHYPPRPRSAPLPRLTASGALLGTPAYMAPEQQERAEVDARADQYSLCLCLAEALLGRPPPDRPSAQTLAASGIDAPWHAIARGLSERPQDRYPRIEDLITELAPAPRKRPARWIALGAVALLATGAIVAWRLTRPERTPARPAPPPVVQAPAPPTAWYWVAAATGPWQLPESVASLAVADEQHAVALGYFSLSVVDLTSGAVTTTPLPEDVQTNLSSLVRVGSRMLALGHDGHGVPTAWEVALSPPGLTAVPIPDLEPGAANDDVLAQGALVSPDGTRLVVCSPYRPAVVRDATTLAVQRTLPGVNCGMAHFSGPHQLAYSTIGEPDATIDVTTGKRTTLAQDADTVFQGPGAWSVISGHRMLRVKDGARTVRIERDHWYVSQVEWTPGATHAIVHAGEQISILPLGDPEADPIALTLSTSASSVGTSSSRVFAVDDRTLITVDLATARVFKPARNLAKLTEVAPRGDAVLASSDEVRVWRDGKIEGRTPSARAIAVGDPGSVVALLTLEGVDLWNPDTDERSRLKALTIYSGLLSRDHDQLAVGDDQQLWRGDIATTLRPWHSMKPDARIRALDLHTERIAVEAADATHIVDLAAHSVWSFYVPAADGTCTSAGAIQFSPDRDVIGIDGAGIELVSTRTRTARRFSSDETWWQWTFLPTGEVLVATESKLLLVDPVTGTARGWDSPIKEQPLDIGIDPGGTTAAVGFEGGSVIWVDVAGLRAHAQPAAITVAPVSLCAPPPPPRSYESLVAD